MGTRILSVVLLAAIATAIHAAPLDLHQAVSAGDKAAVVKLLNKGAKVDARDEKRNTPLHLAVAALSLAKPQTGDLDLVECLIAGGADESAVNGAQETPIGQACLMATKGWRADVRDFLMEARTDDFSLSTLQRKHDIALPAPPPVPETVQTFFLAAENARRAELARLQKAWDAAKAKPGVGNDQQRKAYASLNERYKTVSDPKYIKAPDLDTRNLRAGQVGVFRSTATVLQLLPDNEALVLIDGVKVLLGENAYSSQMTTGAAMKIYGTTFIISERRDIGKDGQEVVWVARRFFYKRHLEQRPAVLANRN